VNPAESPPRTDFVGQGHRDDAAGTAPNFGGPFHVFWLVRAKTSFIHRLLAACRLKRNAENGQSINVPRLDSGMAEGRSNRTQRRGGKSISATQRNLGV